MIERGHISDRNPSVIHLLAKRNAARSRGRNVILLFAVALGIFNLAMAFGVAKGKIQAEYLRAVRREGTAATTILKEGTKEQYVKIKSLNYIEQAGRMAGVGSAYNGKEKIGYIAVLDETAWEEMMKPAYTNIKGHYPEKADEIMVSRRVLEQMGITEPKEGQRIVLTVEIGLFRQVEETFYLSGWYQDYTNPVSHTALAYVSESKLKIWGQDLESGSDILISQKDWMDGHTAEEKLYDDVKMKNDAQSFIGGNTYTYEAVNRFLGGYEMAGFAAFLVLAAVYFLIRNVLWISMAEDIRQMGLLYTLGATKRQIRGLYFRQIGFVFLSGMAAGGGIAWFLLSVWLPGFLGRQYLSQYGGREGLEVHTFLFLLGAVLFVGSVTLFAAAAVVFRTVEMSCLEAMHYTGTQKKKNEGRHRKKIWENTNKKKVWREKEEIWRMAWRNLLRTRGRVIWTILSLFLGVATALGTVVITAGTDYTHVFDKMPDFVIAGEFAPWAEAEGWGKEYLGREPGEDWFLTEGSMIGLLSENDYEEFSPISKETKNQLLEAAEAEEGSVHLTEGAYMEAEFTQRGIQPMIEDMEEAETEQMIIETSGCTIQILTDREIEQLKEFAEEQSLQLDMESLENGAGVLLVQDHILSKEKQKQAEEAIGEPIWFQSLWTKEERERRIEEEGDGEKLMGETWEKNRTEMILCGYIDNTLEEFPKLKQAWHGPGILYFVTSKAGFEKLSTEKKTFFMEINIHQEREDETKRKIQRILSKENQIREKDKETGLFMISRQTLQKEAEGYVKGNRFILGFLSAVLSLAGVMNYFNVMAMGILERQKEFAVLESLGMTMKQQKGMLVREGMGYFFMTVILLIVIGVPALFLLSLYMKARIYYFVFRWPAATAAIILSVFMILCVAVPEVSYWYWKRKNN